MYFSDVIYLSFLMILLFIVSKQLVSAIICSAKPVQICTKFHFHYLLRYSIKALNIRRKAMCVPFIIHLRLEGNNDLLRSQVSTINLILGIQSLNFQEEEQNFFHSKWQCSKSVKCCISNIVPYWHRSNFDMKNYQWNYCSYLLYCLFWIYVYNLDLFWWKYLYGNFLACRAINISFQ